MDEEHSPLFLMMLAQHRRLQQINNTINNNNNMENEILNAEVPAEEVDPFEADPSIAEEIRGENRNPVLDRDFFERVEDTTDEPMPVVTPDPNDLSQLLSREISWTEFTRKLQSVQQSKVTIKEVILQSEVQLALTIKRMKEMYNDEIANVIQRMNDLYVGKIEELNKLYRETLIGEKLINLINKLNGWQLILKPNFAQLCKFYVPPKPVTISVSEDYGTEIEYHQPICHIKAIYVNVLHSKITRGTIQLSTLLQHPNVGDDGLGTACVGELADREIILNEPGKLITLLQEIETTYERIHSDSAYYNPQQDQGGDRSRLSNVPFTENKKGSSTWTA